MIKKIRDDGKAIAQAQFQDRQFSIPYRPEYNRATKYVAATILLQQIWYWWNVKGGDFYKYRGPCDAARPGDSWLEELGLTPYQFDKALSILGQKVTKGDSLSEAYHTSVVIWWTDANRQTWYRVNEENFYLIIGLIYDYPEIFDDRSILGVLQDYFEGAELLYKYEGRNYIRKSEGRDLVSSYEGRKNIENRPVEKTIISEISTENTSENTSENQSANADLPSLENPLGLERAIELLVGEGVTVKELFEREELDKSVIVELLNRKIIKLDEIPISFRPSRDDLMPLWARAQSELERRILSAWPDKTYWSEDDASALVRWREIEDAMTDEKGSPYPKVWVVRAIDWFIEKNQDKHLPLSSLISALGNQKWKEQVLRNA